MQEALIIERQKKKVVELPSSLFEKATYITMLSGFLAMVSYLAINCSHAG